MQFKLFVSFVFISFLTFSQSSSKRVLFIGNSYTSVNNLPQMLRNVALSVNDTVDFDVNAPGGQTFQGHFNNPTSLNKIMAGGWDFVVLQEQSQYPSFPTSQVMAEVFPYARKLDSIVNLYNSCAETVFYMTWGRKNGDASNCSYWPPVCTYNGMDSLLNLRYQMMASQNDAIVSPVGQVWNYIRTNHPEIELYQTDESHPSVAGTYLAACTFYSTVFRKDPTAVTFFAGLSSVDAIKIQNAVKLHVFDSLEKWNIGLYDLNADFDFELSSGGEVAFSNSSTSTVSVVWDFGDGSTSTEINPTHTYAQSGVYEVVLTITECGKTATITKTITFTPLGIAEMKATLWNVYPNPVNQFLQLDNQQSNATFFLIYNAMGEIVHEGKLVTGINKISTEHLVQGIYHIEIRDASSVLGRKKLAKLDFKF